MTPLLKKGDAKLKENYHPVSCLVVASKVMEQIVWHQVTRFFELHGLLPDNQHGIRAKRSAMTALSAMQENWVKNWVKNWDNKEVMGILLLDLSAGYDTPSINLIWEKLKVYRFDQKTCEWFRSFRQEENRV